MELKTPLGKILLDIRNRAIQKGLKFMTEEEVLQQVDEYQKAEDWFLRCSFCGKPSAEVEYLVAGPEVYICSECVKVAQMIIDEKRKQKREKDYVTRVLESKEERNGTNS